MLIYATTQRYVFWVIAALVLIGFVGYLWVNIFRTGTDEIGSEIELAPNRKPYYDDLDMETKRLDRSLAAGVGTLAIVALSLPLYWLGEPGRQDGRVEFTDNQFAGRGEGLYEENCVNCHSVGAVGGVAPYTLLDDQGVFVAQSEWVAPALTTVLERYSRDEVFEILQYGRPQSPMPAWGALGGGPMTTQRVEEVIEYLSRIQLERSDTELAVMAGVRADIETQIRDANPDVFLTIPDAPSDTSTAAEVEEYDAAIAATFDAMNATVPGLGDLRREEAALSAALAEDPDLLPQVEETQAAIERLLNRHYDGLSLEAQGELLFANSADGGSYSCARCHTAGSSWNADGLIAERPEYEGLIVPELPGGGGFGPSLIGVSTQFASAGEQESFIAAGCNLGDQYGSNGFCDSGQMPGFGTVLTPEQIEAIVAYERGL